jgi:DNA-binding NarL/FixJ family response regulator
MSIKIILADDHRITREGIRSLLNEQPDMRVVAETGTGRAAVELAADLAPDVVVMDVTMPELNGVEATRQIKAENPAVKVLVLSMHSERQFVSEMLSAGASGYLLKDCPSDELVRGIRTVAAGTMYLSPNVQGILLKSAPASAAGGRESDWRSLSPREREVLQRVAEGKNTKEIALELHLSPKTVETHRRQVMSKLQLNSVAELTHFAIREGFTSLR